MPGGINPQNYALENLDGPAERVDNTQVASVEDTAGDPATTYNPTRVTGLQTVGWYLSILADPANTGSVYVEIVEATQLTAAQVIAQATHILTAGQYIRLFIPGGSDTAFLAQLAGSAINQAVRMALYEVKEKR